MIDSKFPQVWSFAGCLILFSAGGFLRAQLGDDGTGVVDGYTIGPGADLQGADLSGADLSGASLRGADLTGAKLSGASFFQADLRETQLEQADLEAANLNFADLQNASLVEAKLAQADLGWADLRGAVLRNADLTGANLEGVQLEGASVEGTFLDFRDRAAVAELDALEAEIATREATLEARVSAAQLEAEFPASTAFWWTPGSALQLHLTLQRSSDLVFWEPAASEIATLEASEKPRLFHLKRVAPAAEEEATGGDQ